tara:strand:- start:205 stop:765 length:561 start_codon:yes stop_codon:yes gene_type:complete
MILGLDISTSCTGWCILDSEAELIAVGSISLSKYKSLFSKAKHVHLELMDLLVRHEIKAVFIEENLQAFRPGLSSAKTILTLARFNGIVSYICNQVFEKEPGFINVNSARKELGIKLVRKKNGGKPTKEQIVEWASNELSDTNHHWPTKILKSGPRKGVEILEPACYDMADAYVIARAGLLNILPN